MKALSVWERVQEFYAMMGGWEGVQNLVPLGHLISDPGGGGGWYTCILTDNSVLPLYIVIVPSIRYAFLSY